MSKQQQLRPWAETPAGNAQGYEEEVAALFRRVDVAVHFNPARVPLSALARRRQPRRLSFALAALALLLMGSAGAVAAVRGMPALWRMSLTSSTAPAARAPQPPAPAAPAPVVPAPAAVPAAIPPAPVEVAVQTPARRLRAIRGGKSHRRLAMDHRSLKARPEEKAALPSLEELATEAAAAPEEAPPESQLARESRILQRAYSQLRSDDDPAGALDSLDTYLSAHPLGLLRKEATSGRVEALMKLQRRTEALAALRTFPFGEGARDAELRVLRGELTSGQDCQSALPDFEVVSEKRAASGPVLERALYGQAACEARLGQQKEAESTFRAYLRQFPKGRFSAEARRQLGDTPK